MGWAPAISSTSFLRVRHIFIMSSSSSRKRWSSSRMVCTRVYSRWCRVFTFRTRSRLLVVTCPKKQPAGLHPPDESSCAVKQGF